MNTATDIEYAAFVGIDWADRKHDVCLHAAGSSKREFSVLAHRPECIAHWAQALRQRFGPRVPSSAWLGVTLSPQPISRMVL